MHADVCELWHGGHCSTAIDEATRYTCASILSSKPRTTADLRKQIARLEMQTDQQVHRVRCDCGGEYMSHARRRMSHALRGTEL